MTECIHLQPDDDLVVLRDRLRRTARGRVIVVLPWQARAFSRLVDADLVQREAQRLGLEVAVVSPDPDRRAWLRSAGFPAFASTAQAEATAVWPRSRPPAVEPPPRAWWEQEPRLWPPPPDALSPSARPGRQGVRLAVFVGTILLLLAATYIIGPQALITLVPAGESISVVVPVSVSLDADSVDTVAGTIPARRVGDYFEGFIEVETTGAVAFESGRATGTVLFTNLLAQDILVPAGTVVRTSAGSFPVRFRTTQEAAVPPFGQATAPVEALDEGPAGNVGANQINQVEGVAAVALRVTNPEPISGGRAQEVRAVSQADMDRAWALLTAQLLDQAYQGLQTYLEPAEFLPRQSLEIQAAEVAYNRFLTERADTLGLHMRILVTGLAVDRGNAGAVAYAALARTLPPGYSLVEAQFEVGEVAEESMGRDELTFFVTATGYAAAQIDLDTARRSVLGRSVEEATERLTADLPLAEPARIWVWPQWVGRVPVLPLRIAIQVIPQV